MEKQKDGFSGNVLGSSKVFTPSKSLFVESLMGSTGVEAGNVEVEDVKPSVQHRGKLFIGVEAEAGSEAKARIEESSMPVNIYVDKGCTERAEFGFSGIKRCW